MDEGYEIYATLSVEMSDEDLEHLLGELAAQEPETFYPEAWRIFTGERQRRQAAPRSPRMPIRLSAAVFEDLAPDIQARLKFVRISGDEPLPAIGP